MGHLATLIHDDIVDEAATAGKPTVNALWGDKIALLLGDYYFAKTAGLIADIDDNSIAHLFSDTVAIVCEGIILEMTTAGRIDLTVEFITKKSNTKRPISLLPVLRVELSSVGLLMKRLNSFTTMG